ncbi:hypothetical protein GCM10023092_12130 [Rurimicrobium arvi]|uniref:OmpA family protein n=1 Tax=Rurimicrobium arvi TaxID=2049916 RepID=A0ABP8MQ11_9BACT
MINKKYVLLASFAAAIAVQPAFAQESSSTTAKGWSGRDMTYRGYNYDYMDTNYVPKSRMKQQSKFLANQYAFPSKPRNMWEVGVKFGQLNVSGDVPAEMLWRGSWGLGVHVRKSIGYVFSVRADYNYGNAKGLQWQPSQGYVYNSAWNTTYNPGSDKVFYNYRTELHQLNLDLVASTNNIRFHRAKTGISFYGFFGLSGIAYQTWVNTKDASGNSYAQKFEQIYQQYANVTATHQIEYSQRNKVRKDLRDAMDNTYETDAENTQKNRRPGIFGRKTFLLYGSMGLGTQIRLSTHWNVAIEDRLTIPLGGGSDLLDGQRWAEQTPGFPVMTQSTDALNFFSVGLNYNIGRKSRNVEPLYWMNPLDYAYTEINTPRHMMLPDPVLADADGDGIADQLDKCPGTPAGVAVDAHGCPMDTDGDGVPDYMDKQLITPTECQPVDADGVGNCPCNPKCGTLQTCANIPAASISFGNNASNINSAAQSQLAVLAAHMQANPTCKVVVIGNGNGSKVQQQRSWDRVNAIIEYMSEKNGVDRGRFIFQYGQAGDANTVMIRAAAQDEEGPMNVPPPFPNLKK